MNNSFGCTEPHADWSVNSQVLPERKTEPKRNAQPNQTRRMSEARDSKFTCIYA